MHSDGMMEHDLMIRDTLVTLRSLSDTASSLLHDYNPYERMTHDHHYGIQLRAQMRYLCHKLIQYSKRHYHVTYDAAFDYITMYLQQSK
jgi:chromosome condensin MukBEF ATPase and DNA-binding subunit MukB